MFFKAFSLCGSQKRISIKAKLLCAGVITADALLNIRFQREQQFRWLNWIVCFIETQRTLSLQFFPSTERKATDSRLD